jgi:hypothetical protein
VPKPKPTGIIGMLSPKKKKVFADGVGEGSGAQLEIAAGS